MSHLIGDYTEEEFVELFNELNEHNGTLPVQKWFEAWVQDWEHEHIKTTVEKGSYGATYKRRRYEFRLLGPGGWFTSPYSVGESSEVTLAYFIYCIASDFHAMEEPEEFEMSVDTYIVIKEAMDSFRNALGPVALKEFMELEIW